MSSKEFLETSFLRFFLFEANVVAFLQFHFIIRYRVNHSCLFFPEILAFLLLSPLRSLETDENYDLKFKQKDGISYPEMVSEKFKYICAFSYIVEQNSDSIFREQAIQDFRPNDGESVGCGTVYR